MLNATQLIACKSHSATACSDASSTSFPRSVSLTRLIYKHKNFMNFLSALVRRSSGSSVCSGQTRAVVMMIMMNKQIT